MYRKFHSELHRMAVDFMATNPDFQTALKRFHYYDAEIGAIRTKNEKYRILNWAKAPETSMNTNRFSNSSHVKREQAQNSNLSNIHSAFGRSHDTRTENAEVKCLKCRDPNHSSRNCLLIQGSTSNIRNIDGGYENNHIEKNGEIVEEIDPVDESENEGP